MSSINPIDQFIHNELTPIPADEKPSFNSLRIIHQEINANAMTVPSTRGGGQHGHLALVVPPAEYALIPNTAAWVNPVHPGPAVIYPAAAPTAAQISAADRQYKVDLEDVKLYQATQAQLKKQIIAAVPDTYIKLLKDDRYGYANVTALDLLIHLDDTYGTVTADDLDQNLAKMNAEWSPTQPIEDLWNQIKDCQRYAQPQDPISDAAIIRSALANLEKSGVFTDALKDWRKRTLATQTWDNLLADFAAADKERQRHLTTATSGYANAAILAAATEALNKALATKATQQQQPPTMAYCWSHGLGSNPDHSSATCTNRQPGHNPKATVANMMGGCCIIENAPSTSAPNATTMTKTHPPPCRRIGLTGTRECEHQSALNAIKTKGCIKHTFFWSPDQASPSSGYRQHRQLPFHRIFSCTLRTSHQHTAHRHAHQGATT
jgi:hypothetical protein